MTDVKELFSKLVINVSIPKKRDVVIGNFRIRRYDDLTKLYVFDMRGSRMMDSHLILKMNDDGQYSITIRTMSVESALDFLCLFKFQ